VKILQIVIKVGAVLELSDVFERLKVILSNEMGGGRVFDKDVAEALNITPSNLGALKSRNRIPLTEVMKFCVQREISINWLLFNQDAMDTIDDADKFSKIKYFKNINCSAGGGSFNYEDDYEYITLDESLVASLGLDMHDDLEAINVSGDSMQPTISDNSVVFLDKSNTDITKGGIFAINTPYGLFLKRVHLSLKTNEIELVSDNKSYSSEFMSLNEVDIKGKVVGIISKM
jgi:SOS-response transcriptional repressor LexA